jgi:NosR/NirI family nitrous oxide reductase transcriptional regulator
MNFTSRLFWDRTIGAVALAIIAFAWFSGSDSRPLEILPSLNEMFVGATAIESTGEDSYRIDVGESQTFYATVGEAVGYGGKMKTLVVTNASGEIYYLEILNHQETKAYVTLMEEKGLAKELVGKRYNDQFITGKDVDAISGATYSSQALIAGARDGSREIAVKNLGLEEVAVDAPQVVFGLLEIVVIGLLIFGFIVRSRWVKNKTSARWISMIIGLVVIGFMYNNPMTIVFFNKLLLGYWPSWQTAIFWYVLLGGFVLSIVINNKNLYCEWICPFGTVQECFAAVGNTKKKFSGKLHIALRWFQRLLALGIIVFALIRANPSLYTHEVFGVVFHLIGSPFQFSLLAFVLIASLFLRRPWCSYLCPVGALTDYLSMVRKWIAAPFKPKAGAEES